MKRLLSNLTVINLLLALTIGVIAYYTYYTTKQEINSFAITTTETKAREETAKADPEPSEKKGEASQPQILDYSLITEKNLFHPERKIPEEKKPIVELPKPEIVLYGTLISGTDKIAYLEDLKAPRTTPGRGKRQTALRQGQSISGFKLEEIYEDRIVMVRGEEKMEVKVLQNLDKKPRKADTTPNPTSPAGKVSARK